MKEVYRLPRKSRSYLAFFFNVIVILSFVAPSTAKAALAMDAPQLLYPENGATTTSITDRPLGVPSFSWTAVSGATKYRLQVASGSGFNAPITLDILTNNTSYTPSSIGHLFADNIWYWRVRVENPSVSAWSDPRSFTKTWATAANQPVLFTPADGATLAFFNDPAQNPTVFSWGRVMGAARYRFQISTASDFVSIVLSVDTLATTF